MDRILEISPVDRIAVVEPGVVNAVLSRAVDEHGLYYPPDPSSWESCTIGGNIGTASGGLCCVKYGVTAEYVLRPGRRPRRRAAADHRPPHRQGRRRIRPDQAVRRLARAPSGHRRRAALALRPQPPAQLVLAAEFDSAAAACDAVCAVMERGHIPSLLELMDRTTVRAVNDMAHMGLPDDHRGAAPGRLRHPGPGRRPGRRRGAVRAAGATEVVPADDPAESELLLQARRLSLTALETSSARR